MIVEHTTDSELTPAQQLLVDILENHRRAELEQASPRFRRMAAFMRRNSAGESRYSSVIRVTGSLSYPKRFSIDAFCRRNAAACSAFR